MSTQLQHPELQNSEISFNSVYSWQMSLEELFYFLRNPKQFLAAKGIVINSEQRIETTIANHDWLEHELLANNTDVMAHGIGFSGNISPQDTYRIVIYAKAFTTETLGHKSADPLRSNGPEPIVQHTDSPHSDFPHFDIPHVDAPFPHVDTPHVDAPHFDSPHVDIP
jgi:hypothetical protein